MDRRLVSNLAQRVRKALNVGVGMRFFSSSCSTVSCFDSAAAGEETRLIMSMDLKDMAGGLADDGGGGVVVVS